MKLSTKLNLLFKILETDPAGLDINGLHTIGFDHVSNEPGIKMTRINSNGYEYDMLLSIGSDEVYLLLIDFARTITPDAFMKLSTRLMHE